MAIGGPTERLFAGLAVGYTLAIYLSSGVMRDIQRVLREALGSAFGLMMTASVVLVLAGLLVFCYRRGRQFDWRALALAMIGYAAVLQALPIAEERIHLLQYGLLSVLVFVALGSRLQGWVLHLTTIVLVSVAGVGDELVQHLRPNRVGDLRDVLINTVSALLAQAVIGSVTRPDGETKEDRVVVSSGD